MAKSITVSDEEPAREWLNKLAREADDGELFPDEYELEDVKQLALQFWDDDKEWEWTLLYVETRLSEREAEAVALRREFGLTHGAIALVMSLTGDKTVSRSSVDEYVRRAREKFIEAAHTYDHLKEDFYNHPNWECPGCEQLFDLTEYVAPPTECPNCRSDYFLAKGKPK
jgi:rubrerythrin